MIQDGGAAGGIVALFAIVTIVGVVGGGVLLLADLAERVARRWFK